MVLGDSTTTDGLASEMADIDCSKRGEADDYCFCYGNTVSGPSQKGHPFCDREVFVSGGENAKNPVHQFVCLLKAESLYKGICQ